MSWTYNNNNNNNNNNEDDDDDDDVVVVGGGGGCLTSQQQASVSQGRICSKNFTCCHTEIEVADPTFHLTPSQYSTMLTPGRPFPALTL